MPTSRTRQLPQKHCQLARPATHGATCKPTKMCWFKMTTPHSSSAKKATCQALWAADPGPEDGDPGLSCDDDKLKPVHRQLPHVLQPDSTFPSRLHDGAASSSRPGTPRDSLFANPRSLACSSHDIWSMTFDGLRDPYKIDLPLPVPFFVNHFFTPFSPLPHLRHSLPCTYTRVPAYRHAIPTAS